MEVHDYIDVVIIGGGTAGLRAGVELADCGSTSLILAKGDPCRGIVGLNVLLDEADDTQELFLTDTLRAAAGIGEAVLVKNLIEKSRQELKFLEGLGLEFLHDGYYRPRRTSGNSVARTVYTMDTTGEEIIDTFTAAYTDGGGGIMNNRRAVSIITTEGVVAGVLTLDTIADIFHFYPCKGVIITTGGLGNLYTHSTNGSALSGDGLILALDAGALLRDMEFVQFEPFALHLPGNKSFFSLSFLLEDGPRIYCEDGRKIFADGEVETLSKAQISLKLYDRIVELQRAGKTGRLFFDCTHISPDRLKLHGKLLSLCSRFGILLERDPLPFTPAQHYLLGGIDVNERYETAVTGLFAAGEAAGCTHGADRLAGNSAIDALVSGHLAASSAFQYLNNSDQLVVNEQKANELLESAYAAKEALLCNNSKKLELNNLQELQRLMWDFAGIVRCKDDLLQAKEGIQRLEDLWKEIANPSVNSFVVDFQAPDSLGMSITWSNQLAVAEMIVESALMRKESRGVHYRSDFPNREKSISKSILIRKEGSHVVFNFG
jgi:L-aspartate oxidase